MAEDDATATPKRPRARRKPSVAVPAEVPGPVGSTPAVAEDGASLEADRVDLRMAAVGRVEAGSITVEQGALGAARADSVSVDRGALGAAMADRIEVSRGYARSVLARSARLERSAARVVVAGDAEVEQSAVVFLIARRVAGDVRVLLDWRGAVAFGATAGVVLSILSRLRRRAP